MLLDSQLVPETLVRPRSFVGLMAVYESNYLRLLQLVPELERLDGCFRSRVAGDCELFLEVLERCRYTITMSLTYQFDSDEGRIADPDVKVRAYLDGRLAEAMSIGVDHQHAPSLPELSGEFNIVMVRNDASWFATVHVHGRLAGQ